MVGNQEKSDSQTNDSSSEKEGVGFSSEEREALKENILSSAVAVYERALETAFVLKKDFLVHELSRKLSASKLSPVLQESEQEVSEEWIGIESLSRLRNLVGGRFQNLKKKWINAGFPLREHRGDRGSDYEIVEKGWIELSNWILKQGYEARVLPNDSVHLFELRVINK